MASSDLVLVTGGAGFIGSHLVEALLEQDYSVRAVDNLVTGHRSNLAHLEGKFDWIEGDLADFDVCRRVVEGMRASFTRRRFPASPGPWRIHFARTQAGRP